ncbi:MAG: hypothetical protein ABIH26_00480, partial [Candidatus Eisenbacteria bacterium]
MQFLEELQDLEWEDLRRVLRKVHVARGPVVWVTNAAEVVYAFKCGSISEVRQVARRLALPSTEIAFLLLEYTISELTGVGEY